MNKELSRGRKPPISLAGREYNSMEGKIIPKYRTGVKQWTDILYNSAA